MRHERNSKPGWTRQEKSVFDVRRVSSLTTTEYTQQHKKLNEVWVGKAKEEKKRS